MTRFRDATMRIVVGILAATAIASTLFLWIDKYGAQALSPAVRASSNLSYFYLAVALESVVVLAAAVLALILVWKAVRQSGADYLALFLAGVAFFQTGTATALMLRTLNIEWAGQPSSILTLPVLVAALTALIRFTALFPAPLQLPRDDGGRARRLLSGVQRATLVPSRLWVIGGVAAVLLLVETLLLRSGSYAPGVQLGDVLIPLALFVAVLNLRASYRAADKAGRAKLHWVIEGMLIAAFAIALRLVLMLIFWAIDYTPAIRVWQSLLYSTGLLGMIACLALAVFYTGALDSRLVLRRTSVAGTATLLILVLFVSIESVLSNALENRLPERWSGWVGGVAVGLTVNSMHRRIERIIDRLIVVPDGKPRLT